MPMDTQERYRARGINVTNLRRIRFDRLLTQVQLGQRAGIDPTHISKLENGQRADFGTIQKLADALDVEPADLLE